MKHKELIETAIVAILVVFATFVVINTRGSGTFDFSKLKVDISLQEESFSYPLEPDDRNGQYRRITGDNRHILFGKNPDGTFRLYFIQTIGHIKNIVLRIDDLELDNLGEGHFENSFGTKLRCNVTKDQIIVRQEALGIGGDATLEGNYMKYKKINSLSLDEMTITKN